MFATKILTAGLLTMLASQDPGTLRGLLRYDPQLEGGVWTLTVDGKVYDLHGDLEGRKDGDRVEVEGQALPHRVCIHQVGIVFRVTKIRLLPAKEMRGFPGRFF
ncbi:MAG TPA: hypothetical protein VJB14_18480 [Planctomycetota bacterium]|nr:hypothetical protein [Planctomycetota bacterium]